VDALTENDQINSWLAKIERKASIRDLPKSNDLKNQLASNAISLRSIEHVSASATDQQAYCIVANKVKSVIDFVKVAYPDLIGGDGARKVEPLNIKDGKVCRSKLLTSVERGLHIVNTIHEVVYDLDALAISANRNGPRNESVSFGNSDEKRVGVRSVETKQLRFESRFESGNLRKAIQVESDARVLRNRLCSFALHKAPSCLPGAHRNFRALPFRNT